jgi:predicted enzyme related to lactoylglutathione lyase
MDILIMLKKWTQKNSYRGEVTVEDLMKVFSSMKAMSNKSGENPFSKICQIGITVNDVEETISFIEKIFGFGPFTRIPREEGNIAVCEVGGLQFELIENPEMGWKAGHIHLAFFIDDMDRVLNELQNKGVGTLIREDFDGMVDFAMIDTEKKSHIAFELIQVKA